MNNIKNIWFDFVNVSRTFDEVVNFFKSLLKENDVVYDTAIIKEY